MLISRDKAESRLVSARGKPCPTVDMVEANGTTKLYVPIDVTTETVVMLNIVASDVYKPGDNVKVCDFVFKPSRGGNVSSVVYKYDDRYVLLRTHDYVKHLAFFELFDHLE